MQRLWSKSEITKLKRLWEQGKSAVEIGASLDRSRNAVLGKIYRLGLARNPHVVSSERTHWHCGHPATPENKVGGTSGYQCRICNAERQVRNERFAAEYLGGMTARQIAERHGVKTTLVQSALYSMGVKLSKAEHARRAEAAIKNKRGPKPVWPDCPPELRKDYTRFRKSYGYAATEARAMLEAVA